MIKIIRIFAVLLLVSTAVISAQAALNSFYGIENSNLSGRVWGQGSSTDETDGGSDGSSSSDDDVFGTKTTTGCDYTTVIHVQITQSSTLNGKVGLNTSGGKIWGLSVGLNTGSWSSSQNVTFIHHGRIVTCPGINGYCSDRECFIDFGSVPYSVFGSEGTSIEISTN